MAVWTHVLVHRESTMGMHYLNRVGGTRSRSLEWKVEEISGEVGRFSDV